MENENFQEHYAEYINALNGTFNETEYSNWDILHPNNPLMKKFQRALKNLLEKQICRLNEDLNEMGRNLKSLKNDKLKITEIAFNEEEQIQGQQRLLYQCRRSISDLIAMKDEADGQMSQMKNKLEVELKQTDRLNNENNHLRERLDFLNMVICKLADASNKNESDLVIVKRMMEKNDRDKRIIFYRKQMQDVVLMKLEKDIMNLEVEERNLRLKQFEQTNSKGNNLNNAVITTVLKLPDENNYSSLSIENAELFVFWRNIIDAIGDRDQTYCKMMTELTNLDNRRRELEIEISNAKKINIQTAIIKGEALMLDEDKTEKYYNHLIREHIQLTKDVETTENSLNTLSVVVENTQKTLKQIASEKINAINELTVCCNVVKKLNMQNTNLEEMLFHQLQEQIIRNSGASNINANINRTQDRIKEYENLLSSYDAEYSTVLLNCENSEDKRKNFFHHLELIQNEQLSKQTVVNDLKMQLDRAKKMVEKLSVCLANRNTDLNHIREKVPIHEQLQEKINVTGKDMHKLTIDDKELKRKWIRQQNEIMKSIELKEDQIHKMASIKNKIFVLQYKKMNLEYRLNQTEIESAELSKRMSRLLSAISKINSSVSKKKELKGILDRNGVATYGHYFGKLKDAEDDMLNLVKEIDDLELSKEDGYEKLLDLQQKDLFLENNVKMASNMRSEILKEKNDGDIGNMKIEIHHMEIRYTQLKRVQDKLSADLEMCILKRNNIMDGVLSESKKDRSHYLEEVFARKLDCINNKILKIKQDVNKSDEKYYAICNDIVRLKANLKDNTERKEDFQKNLSTLSSEFKHIYVNKHKHLELCIYKQRKLSYLFQAKNGSYIPLYRSPGALEAEYLKQSCLNSDLTSVMEALNNDFPLCQEDVTKILHFLNIALL